MKQRFFILLLIPGICVVSCKSLNNGKEKEFTVVNETSDMDSDSSSIYHSDNLVIQKITNHGYVHVSYLNTETFGRVDCNGMFVINGGEAVVFDTPADEASTEELVNFITENFHCKIVAIIPGHFHEDCVAGLEIFNSHNIPTYASNRTKELLKNQGKSFSKPIIGFEDSITLHVGSKEIVALYFGEGHTKDNIIGYFPEDDLMFGGCLIKTIDASKGFLGDANTDAWPFTVAKIKNKYPNTKVIVPGHGPCGSSDLLDYTIELFK